MNSSSTNGYKPAPPPPGEIDSIDSIMEAWHNAVRDAKEFSRGAASKGTLINEEVHILATQIIPHTFRFGRGEAPNELGELQESETCVMLWNYPEFAERIQMRATGFGITPAELFSRAVAALKNGTNGSDDRPRARVEFLKTLFGAEFVARRIGDTKIIYEFLRKHKPDRSDDREELKTTPRLTIAHA